MFSGMVSVWVSGKTQEFRLEARDFFETHLRPVLRRIHDGNRRRRIEEHRR